jgi:dihydrofolate reductase
MRGSGAPRGHPVGERGLPFVTGGIEAALEQARAAGGKDVSLAGGANAGRQYLAAGLVDEMEINLVPTLLGSGERLFDGVDDLHGLELVRTVGAPSVTHLTFARRRGGSRD